MKQEKDKYEFLVELAVMYKLLSHKETNTAHEYKKIILSKYQTEVKLLKQQNRNNMTERRILHEMGFLQK